MHLTIPPVGTKSVAQITGRNTPPPQ